MKTCVCLWTRAIMKSSHIWQTNVIKTNMIAILLLLSKFLTSEKTNVFPVFLIAHNTYLQDICMP